MVWAFGRGTVPGLLAYRGLVPVSRDYPHPEGRLATCYAAVRHAPFWGVRLPWLSPTPIAVGSARIKRSRGRKAWPRGILVWGVMRVGSASVGSEPLGVSSPGLRTPIGEYEYVPAIGGRCLIQGCYIPVNPSRRRVSRGGESPLYVVVFEAYNCFPEDPKVLRG